MILLEADIYVVQIPSYNMDFCYQAVLSMRYLRVWNWVRLRSCETHLQYQRSAYAIMIGTSYALFFMWNVVCISSYADFKWNVCVCVCVWLGSFKILAIWIFIFICVSHSLYFQIIRDSWVLCHLAGWIHQSLLRIVVCPKSRLKLWLLFFCSDFH